MRKALLYMIGLIMAGIISYYIGYQFYETNRSQMEFKEQQFLQKGSSKDTSYVEDSYYLMKIEEEKLIIYLMPAKDVYDSLKISGLQLLDSDRAALEHGKRFEDLIEVFAFLESCMS